MKSGHQDDATAPGGGGVARLVDALQQLSTLLLLTAEAVDNIVSVLTGQEPDSAPDIQPESARPKLSVVRPIDEPPQTAPRGADASAQESACVRDVEPRENGHWRGRVRWLDPETKRYRSRSKNFDDPAAAWAWANRWAPGAGH